jgi:hypothetical protein
MPEVQTSSSYRQCPRHEVGSDNASREGEKYPKHKPQRPSYGHVAKPSNVHSVDHDQASVEEPYQNAGLDDDKSYEADDFGNRNTVAKGSL